MHHEPRRVPPADRQVARGEPSFPAGALWRGLSARGLDRRLGAALPGARRGRPAAEARRGRAARPAGRAAAAAGHRHVVHACHGPRPSGFAWADGPLPRRGGARRLCQRQARARSLPQGGRAAGRGAGALPGAGGFAQRRAIGFRRRHDDGHGAGPDTADGRDPGAVHLCRLHEVCRLVGEQR